MIKTESIRGIYIASVHYRFFSKKEKAKRTSLQMLTIPIITPKTDADNFIEFFYKLPDLTLDCETPSERIPELEDIDSLYIVGKINPKNRSVEMTIIPMDAYGNSLKDKSVSEYGYFWVHN